ncbi:MAG: repressor LexA [Planctomycetia bacterium]|nr:repressor LexA [Planctomycetia bacterium]
MVGGSLPRHHHPQECGLVAVSDVKAQNNRRPELASQAPPRRRGRGSQRKGLITRGKNMSRAIELVNEPAHLRGLPMAGWVAAGTLRAAEEQSERIDFESLFNRDNHFVLKVMGESMIDAQIADGDWVVIQKKQTAHAGDIVVAQTEDGEATLKQWFPERDRIRLQPANAAMKPIYVRNARVLGVLVGVVRKT